MKRLRRIAALLLAILLGTVTWIAVVLSARTEGELRLARELSTGRLLARVPPPAGFSRVVTFGPPSLIARYTRPAHGASGTLPPGVVYNADPQDPLDQLWYVNLDPLDKSWELEVTESRPVYLQLAAKRWRIGTKTRVWRTNRSAPD